jgi:hypothetical protein
MRQEENVFVMPPNTIFIKKEAEKCVKYKGFMILEMQTNVKYTRKCGINRFQKRKPIEIPWN